MLIEVRKLSIPDPFDPEEKREVITYTGELVDIKRGLFTNYVIWKDKDGYLHEDRMTDVRIIRSLNGFDITNNI